MQRKYKYISMSMLFIISVVCTIYALKILDVADNNVIQNYKYVLVPSLSTDQVVTNSAMTLVKPYTNASVEITVNYYDDSEENHEKSIIVADNLYLQNVGILYTAEVKFDVLCVLDGYVSNVGSNEVIGNYVEITHVNDIVSLYQVLDEIVVTKGTYVKQGDKIGASGNSKVLKGENLLLFELTINEKNVNPEKYYNKSIEEI